MNADPRPATLPNHARRRFLAGAVGLAACAGGARSAPLANVIVLGAGMAGLYAATCLEQRGFQVTVLEARSRVGGRNWTLRGGDGVTDLHGADQRCEFSPGQRLEAGAWRILPTHQRMRQLASQLAIPLQPIDPDSGALAPPSGMDSFARQLADQLAAPPLTDSIVTRVGVDKRTQRVQVHYLQHGQAQTLDARFVIIALPLCRLPALALDLPPLAMETADALKAAFEADPLPARPALSPARHWQLIWPAPDSGQRIVGVYANPLALRDEFTDDRAEQLRRTATKLPSGLALRQPLAIQWSRIPHQQAAATRLRSRGTLSALRQGKPPLFFASDALSTHNGWQEGALESAAYAVERLWLHWSAQRN